MTDLFSDQKVLSDKYAQDTVNSILRVRDMYLWVVKFPYLKDSDFVKEDCRRYKVSRPTAYADLNLIKALVPDMSKTTKDFARWRFSEMILDTFEIARFKKDVKTMEKAAGTYAKYMGIDREEEIKLPLDKIIPPPLIPTEDPSVLGFEPIPDRRNYINRLIEKYSRDMPELKDIREEEAEVRGFLDISPDSDDVANDNL